MFITFGFQYIFKYILLCSWCYLLHYYHQYLIELIFTTILISVFIELFAVLSLIKGWIWLDNSDSNLAPMMRIAITVVLLLCYLN